jgi:hypothetical protein
MAFRIIMPIWLVMVFEHTAYAHIYINVMTTLCIQVQVYTPDLGGSQLCLAVPPEYVVPHYIRRLWTPENTRCEIWDAEMPLQSSLSSLDTKVM